MLIEILGDTAALTLIIAFRYVVVAAIAYRLFWGGVRDTAGDAPRRGPRRGQLNRRPPSRAAVRHEVASSLLASPIYALPVAVLLVLWRRGGTALYVDPAAHGWLWLPASAAIYLVAHDAYYYWLHRALHHPRLFALCHRGHHLSRDPTPFASFSFDPAEAALTAWFLPALALVIPIQVGLALGLLMLMTLTAVMNHAGREVWPQRWLDAPLGRAVITARHHDLHHKRFNGNYGLYFSVWDRLMGTELARETARAATGQDAGRTRGAPAPARPPG